MGRVSSGPPSSLALNSSIPPPSHSAPTASPPTFFPVSLGLKLKAVERKQKSKRTSLLNRGLYCSLHGEKEMAKPTPVFLPGDPRDRGA